MGSSMSSAVGRESFSESPVFPSQISPVSPVSPPISPPRPVYVEPTVVERADHDRTMRLHLISQSSAQKVQTTLFAATKFVAQAQQAKAAVLKRKLSRITIGGKTSSASELFVNKDDEDEAHRPSEKVVEGTRLLQQRCDFIKVRRVKMEGDGNCQFRALANELCGNQRHHMYVRTRIVARLRAKSEEYSAFVGEPHEYSHYLSRMSKTKTWGDELTLRAACEEFECIVHVVTTTQDNWLLHYYPEALTDLVTQTDKAPPQGTREVFLAYVAPIHYDVIAPTVQDAK